MTLRLNGTSSGFTEIDAPAAAGSNKITLPTSNGSAEQFLKNSGTAGELEFSSMVETSTGIGIGTTSPQSKLSVGNAASTDNGLSITFTGDNSTLAKYFANTATGEVTIGGVASSYFPTFHSGGNEGMRLDTSGRLLVGTTSSKESLSNIQCVSASNSTVSIFSSNTSASGQAKINLGPSNNITGAQIICDAEEDFSTGANRTGRLGFTTRKDGTITERARITSNGYLKAANNASYYDDDGPHHEFNQSGTDINMIFRTTAPNTGATQVYLGVDRAATSAYWFLQGVSSFSGSADTEFYIRGDGNAFADGSWSGGGADYAEYFEWSDGNTEAEDRRGISVVLDGDKIREAVTGEEPIGVISGNPSVVGDADVDRWKGKYLRDDYGTYIQEDYEVEDDDGNTVVQQRRTLNPDYNPETAYVSREDRPEWDTVGLMGKLRIRKGQVTGARWIKMRDVSDTVEEWLVR